MHVTLNILLFAGAWCFLQRAVTWNMAIVLVTMVTAAKLQPLTFFPDYGNAQKAQCSQKGFFNQIPVEFIAELFLVIFDCDD